MRLHRHRRLIGLAALAAAFDDLGYVKGNIGSQNYLIPADVRLDRYRSVVVWCKRFSVPFAAAPL